MTRDRLEDAFLRLRAAARADEYVPMENVIEVVLAENARLRAEAKRADEEATTLANSDLATTEQVVRALRAENARLRDAVTLGMHYLKGRYPVPVKEKEVLAQMQAALDVKEKQ